MIFVRGSDSLTTPMWFYVCFLLICMHLSKGSGTEKFEVQYTVHRDQNKTLQFQQTTLLNGQVIFSCSSQTLRDLPRRDWIMHAYTEKDLEDRHRQCQRQYLENILYFEKIEETISDTTLDIQRRHACITKSSSILELDEWAVNGENFLTFDPSTLKWSPLSNEANHFATEWNRQDIRNRVYGYFGQTLCNKAHKILKMNQTARTDDDSSNHTGIELHGFGKYIPGGVFLECHVIASDLSEVKIQLTQDGVPLECEGNLIGPRPNGDGTVQMRVQIETSMDGNNEYCCEAQSGTFDIFALFVIPPNMHYAVDTVAYVFVTVTCALAFTGVICWRWQQVRPGVAPVSTHVSFTSSNST